MPERILNPPMAPSTAILLPGLFLFCLLVALAGMLLVPLPEVGRVGGALLDLCHAPASAIATCAVFYFLHSLGIRPWILGAIASGFLVICFTGFAEAVQPLMGRTASLADLIANGVGVAVAMLWIYASQWNRSSFLGSLIKWSSIGMLSLGLLMLPSWRPMEILADTHYQQHQLPEIASFEHSFELTRWRGHHSQLSQVPMHATSGDWALEVKLGKGKYPGVKLTEPPEDWSQYQALVFDLVWEKGPSMDNSQKVRFELQLQDAEHQRSGYDPEDRYRRVIELQPGPQEIRVELGEVLYSPAGRLFDLSEVRLLSLFALRPFPEGTLYLDSVRLE
ncbi:Hypothetical protein PBC10988_14950 [Planctomycetales bacterium 10988]|nr:Hypothetical protein PBC10988_14950 [Planctomycetales bacterium 10988]